MNENIGRLHSPYVFLIQSFFKYLLQSGTFTEQAAALCSSKVAGL
jgi:hypothetical protein